MTTPASQPLEVIVDAAADAAVLDGLGKPIGKAVRGLGPGPLKDAASGTWMGHALHPLLTDVVIGCWTSASLLDLFGGQRLRRRGAAPHRDRHRRLPGRPPRPALSDWADSESVDDDVRRVGLVHAAVQRRRARPLRRVARQPPPRPARARHRARARRRRRDERRRLPRRPPRVPARRRRRPDGVRPRPRRLDRRGARPTSSATSPSRSCSGRAEHAGAARPRRRRRARAARPLLAPRLLARHARRDRGRRHRRARATAAASTCAAARSCRAPRRRRSRCSRRARSGGRIEVRLPSE